jgi:hypothetical protein
MTEPVPDAFEVFRGRWAMEIGRFVMAFGSIEGMTYALVRSNFDAAVADVLLKTMDLGKRLDVLIAMAQGRGGKWIAVADVLTKVEKLAEKRNLIAHNGVTVDVFLSPDNKMSITEAIRSHRSAVKAAAVREGTSPATAVLLGARTAAEAVVRTGRELPVDCRFVVEAWTATDL